MTKFVGYIAMSIDARIADAQGSVAWLDRYRDPATDFGYAEFIKNVDAIVMGRTTYDFHAPLPEWPFADFTTYVVTSRPLENPPSGVVPVAADWNALRARLVAGEDETIWIMGGGHTQRGALDAGMFDELHLFIMPVVLGGGPLVFADGATVDADLVDHRVWPGDVVELKYLF